MFVQSPCIYAPSALRVCERCDGVHIRACSPAYASVCAKDFCLRVSAASVRVRVGFVREARVIVRVLLYFAFMREHIALSSGLYKFRGLCFRKRVRKVYAVGRPYDIHLSWQPSASA